MAILSGIPVLNCQSIEDTLAFYQQLLQFVIVKKRDLNGALCWVHIMHGDTTVMLQSTAESQSPGETPANSGNISLYFFINDIKALHHFVKAKNTKVTEIKTTEYQMQEFSLIDPEGNMVTVGQKA